jgi:hypothetical protein
MCDFVSYLLSAQYLVLSPVYPLAQEPAEHDLGLERERERGITAPIFLCFLFLFPGKGLKNFERLLETCVCCFGGEGRMRIA